MALFDWLIRVTDIARIFCPLARDMTDDTHRDLTDETVGTESGNGGPGENLREREWNLLCGDCLDRVCVS